ncbi:CBS domain-containing protein [Haladaptatus cibarius]|uniref:CBS domain-containing protein n=1 Tax=Haladaptatus cibarius TaxID=453847 RepID=UPI0006790431|nr:CBS domain-containing protein [Haladaptatus cibarius]
MTVSDIAATDVVTATEDATLAEIVQMMGDESVGCVPIVNNDEPVGIVTDRKIALSLADDGNASNRAVSEIMTRDLTTIESDANVHDAVEQMEDAEIRRLPVVESGQLTGLVTLDDVLVAVADELDEVADVIEEQSPRL